MQWSCGARPCHLPSARACNAFFTNSLGAMASHLSIFFFGYYHYYTFFIYKLHMIVIFVALIKYREQQPEYKRVEDWLN